MTALKNIKKENWNWNLIFLSPNIYSFDYFCELVVKFYKIWPPMQWITSLSTLIILYWVSGYFYNKFLSSKGGWMTTKTRIFMISVDLIINFSLGIYYMHYRNTFIGALMLKCPVFFSPLFWIIELIFFYIYYRYNFSLKKTK